MIFIPCFHPITTFMDLKPTSSIVVGENLWDTENSSIKIFYKTKKITSVMSNSRKFPP